jgi:hypothetical protein
VPVGQGVRPQRNAATGRYRRPEPVSFLAAGKGQESGGSIATLD